MAIETRARDGVLVIEFLDPELSNETRIHRIGDEVKRAIDESRLDRAVLDFQHVSFMSSAMLGQLAMLSQRGRAGDLQLKLCNVAPEMREVLRIVRLDTLLDIVGDEDAAVDAFRQEEAQQATADTAEALVDDVSDLRRSAQSGDANSAFRLGRCLETGRGAKADYAEALKMFRQAAEAGHCEAQHALAMSYAYGMNVAQDYDEATRWYLKAAEQGHAESQYAIGVNYCYGIGVEQDLEAARHWYEKAAAQGHQKAGEAIEEMVQG